MNRFIKLIAFVLLTMPGKTFSQVNSYFDNNPIWTINSACATPLPCIEYQTKNYYIQGDSILNNLVYKKIYRKGLGHFNTITTPPGNPCPHPYWYIDTVPLFILRSIDKEMFIRFPYDTTEYLLYDFNLNIGDTLPPTYQYSGNDIIVSGIDSILTPNGYLKKFELSGNNSATHLLEGIGNSNGLIEPFFSILECAHTLSCFSLNDTSYFPISGPSCNISVGIQDLITPEKITIYPNPASGFVSIRVKTLSKNAMLTVYNSIGKPMKVLHDINLTNFVLNTDELNPGIYFLFIDQGNGSISEKKLIIN